MDDKKVADYFVVAGIDWSNQPLLQPEEDFPIDAKTPPGHQEDPIVELAVIHRSYGETIPEGFKCIEFTPTGFPADLNHGSIRSPEIYFCYRRGRDMPPIVDIGIIYDGKDIKERLLPGCEIIYLTRQGRSANINNTSGVRIFVTFRRASPTAPCDILVVTEICVIMANRGEVAPHAHCVIKKDLNTGLFGSDIYLCYKKSMVKITCLNYKPSILSRYPMEDLPQVPLPQQVSMFCLPMGATLESWSPLKHPPTPVFSTFVLTTGLCVEKVYGAAVIFQEPLSQDKLDLLDDEQRRALEIFRPPEVAEGREGSEGDRTPGNGGLVVYQNKSICLLSRSPFFDTFKKFLFYIYRLVFSTLDEYSQQIPLERHIAHFLSKIPMPCLQRPRIMIQLSTTSIILTQPDDTPLPKSGASFVDVLKNLGPYNCMLLLLSVLMEHKILIHSLRPAVLTGVAEAIAAMIFPLQWQCPYIPLCPLSLSYVLHSPTPFIVGIDSRYFDTFELPTDVTCVDLDTNTLTICEDRRSHTIKMLPKKSAKHLKLSLERLYERLSDCPEILTPTLPREGTLDATLDAELAITKKRMKFDLSIREAYLRFMASTLKGYNDFLLPITNAPTDGAMDLNSLFDISGFVKSRDKSYHKFYALLMKTQTFSRFIEERSFVSDKDSCLAFFDYCLERVEDVHDGQKLIEIDETLLSSERTVLIMGPEPDDPDQPPIIYPGHFPDLDPTKFNEGCNALPSTSLSCPADCHSTEQGHHQPGSVHHNLGFKVAGYNSPMFCRTQHEVKQSQKIAMKHANVPGMWARFLAWHCYSLWFIHLSSYANFVHSKSKVLRSAYDILVTMQSAKLQPPDEVCYRVLMQLCGIYHLPILAVKVLFEMKRRGIQPNAITYGFYNKAVLESKWPTSNTTADQLWTKLRNVIMAVAHFKRSSAFFLASQQPTSGASFRFGAAADQSLPVLAHSNSESDPDRQSMDSYLDSVEASGSVVVSHNTNIVSNIIGTTQNITTHPANQNITTHPANQNITTQPANQTSDETKADPPKKSFEDEKALGELKNNSNNHLEKLANQSSPNKTRPESQTNQASGSRQRARSTSEVGGDIDLIGAMKHKSKESISAGGLSDRGYGSLSMEETRDATIFTSQSLSTAAKSKDTHKSAEVTPTHCFHDDESPEKEELTSSDCQTRTASSITSIRVPVTQNDPLGLFDPPVQVASTVVPSSEKSTDEETRTSNTAHLLLFSSPSFHQTGRHGDAEVRPPSSKVLESRTIGFEGSSARQVQSSKQKAPTWVSMAKENMVGGGSELFGSALKMVTTKFSQYRDVISNGGVRSNSTHRAESIGSLDSAESSSDCSYVGHKTNDRRGEVIQVHDSESGVDVSLPSHPKRSSVTFQETPNKGPSTNSRVKGSPFVSNLWNGLKTLQKSDAFKGLASGLSQMGTSVKATVKETLTSDVWSLSNNMAFGVMPSLGTDFYGGSISGGINEEDEECEDDDEKIKGGAKDEGDDPPSKRHLPLRLDDPTCPYASTIEADRGGSQDQSRDLNSDPRRGQYNPGSISSIPSTVSGAVPLNPYLHPVQVEMSTTNKCNKCLNLLYDEEIMAGWTSDDSNLNTSCQFCTSLLVPFINIYIKDYRPFLKVQPPSNLSQSSESILSCQSTRQPIKIQSNCPTTVDASETIDSMSPSSHDAQDKDCTDNGQQMEKVVTERKIVNDDNEEEEDGEVANTVGGCHDDDPVVVEATTPKARRCASISSLPEATKDSMSDKRNKAGSVDALNDNNRIRTETISRSENEIYSAEDEFSSKNFVDLPPLYHPYLSPLVLRKEVENLLVQEGEGCFDGDTLLDEHPILFWNLVWYFKRLDIPSHLPSFIATSKSLNKHLQEHDLIGQQALPTSQSKHSVVIKAMWDNTRLHTDHGPPMYALWNRGSSTHEDIFSRKMMTTIVECVMKNDVLSPLRLILSERARHLISLQSADPQPSSSPHPYSSFHSIYRDVLFLSFVSLGRDNIDIDAFDKEFKNVLSDLSPYDSARLRVADRVPRSVAISCRKVFRDLDL